MTKIRITTLPILAICAFAVCSAATFAEEVEKPAAVLVAKPNAIADILPEGTIMFADLRPWGEWSADFSKTAVAQIFSEPEVRQFMAGPFSQISYLIKRSTEVQAAAGPEVPNPNPNPPLNKTPNFVSAAFQVLGSITPGPFSIAVRYSAEDAQAKRPPAVAAIIGFRDERDIEQKKDMLAGLLDAFLKNMNVEAINVTDYHNVKLISITPQAADGQRKNIITLTLNKGRVIVSNEIKLSTQIIDGLAGTLEKKLSDSATYKNCELAGNEHLSAFLDIAGLQTAYGAMEKLPADHPNQLDDFFVLAGLNKSVAVAWSLRMSGPAFESRTAIFSKGERAGLLGTLDDEPLSADAMKICPASTPFATGFRLHSDRVLPFIRNAIKALQGEKGLENFDEVVKQLNAETGKNLEKEMSVTFGNELVVTSLAGMENTGPIGAVSAFAASLSVKDPAKADDLLGQMLARVAARNAPDGAGANVLKETDFDGSKIRYLMLQPVGGLIKFSPAFAFYQNRLLMALDVPTLKRAMGVVKSGNSLADSPAFKQALAESGGKMGPMFHYMDWAFMYKTAFNLGSDALKVMAPPDVLRAIGVDINLLPETETVAKHLFPGLSIARITPNGIVMVSRSPLPSFEVLVPPMAAVSAAISSFKPFVLFPAKQ